MTRRSIVALGVTQCLNWGVLYYAFGALLIPVQRDLGVSQSVVAAAFSLGLLVSAAIAPWMGRLCDRGHGVRAMRWGAIAAALLLWAWALVPHVATLYLVWAGLGVCMAATLYEPAFAIVGRSLRDPRDRLRALSAVTVLGGLASTALLPATAFVIDRWNWRTATAVLGAVMAASAALTVALRRCEVLRTPAPAAADTNPVSSPRPRLGVVIALFSLASFSAAAFAATAVAAFAERGLTPTVAATMVGLFGVLQLPGRLILMSGLQFSASRLAIASLSAQAVGLAVIAAAPLGVIAVGVALLAIGNGVMTLVRPHLVQTTFGMSGAGERNGAIARGQHVARAFGPIAAAGLASYIGYQLTFVIMALALGGLAACWRAAINPLEPHMVEQEIL